jgi:hypothetical protein
MIFGMTHDGEIGYIRGRQNTDAQHRLLSRKTDR